MAAMTVKTATAISIVIEGILYGLSMALFAMIAWLIVHKRIGAHAWRLMLAASSVLAILSTLHIITDARNFYRGFISFDGSSSFFDDLLAVETFKNTVYLFETLVADGILIYRAFIVWNKWWPILLPFLGWLGIVVAGSHTIWSIEQPVVNLSTIFLKQTGQWVISFYSIGLATNLIATSLLATKLWMAQRSRAKWLISAGDNRGSRLKAHSSLFPLLLVILECGALYSCSLITMLAIYLSKSNVAYIIIDMIGQIIPITFYIVILRAGMTQLQAGDPAIASLSTVSFAHRRKTQTETIPMSIKINRFMESDGGDTSGTRLSTDGDIVDPDIHKDPQVAEV